MGEPICKKCDKIIEEGDVVAHGESLIHLECFTCTICSKKVNCASNLLVLDNNTLVCEGCSHSCNVCKQVIRDKAIMTAENAYHADCFRCISCKNNIENLLFIQSRKGIRCVPCHEKRKAEKQKIREKQKMREQREQEQLQKLVVNNNSSATISLSADSGSFTSSPSSPQQQQNENNHQTWASKGFSSQQGEFLNNTTRTTSLRPSVDPPTPSRSRSNSSESLPTNKKVFINAHLTTSRTEIVTTTKNPSPTSSSPSSPPLSSIDSYSPTLTNASNQTNKFRKSLSSSSLTNSAFIAKNNDSLNLSFFESESTDIVNLANRLGENISLGLYSKESVIPAIVKTTQNITRASQYLEDSLDKDSIEFLPFLCTDSKQTDKLAEELESAYTQLDAMKKKYTNIKDASRKALEEFMSAKEEFQKEVAVRQEQESALLQLKHQMQIICQARQKSRPELLVITNEEIKRAVSTRVELDRTCNELRKYRGLLAQDIESLSQKKQAGLVDLNVTLHLEQQQLAINTEIISLYKEREQIIKDTEKLKLSQEEALNEIVTLNIKNAELSDMNNDLSRRISEREKEIGAMYLGTPSSSSPLSARPSYETQLLSNIQLQQLPQPQPPKVVRLKKKNVFAILSGKKSNPNDNITSTIHKNNFSDYSPKTSQDSIVSPFVDYTTQEYNNASESTSHKYINSGRQSLENMHHGLHEFVAATFYLSPVKCEACSEKMRRHPGLKCKKCHCIIHVDCLAKAPQKCLPMGVFGVDLTERVNFEGTLTPVIVRDCIEALKPDGMHLVGLYRLSGGKTQVDSIKDSYDKGEDITLKNKETPVVTSVLKKYFMELPEPLLTSDLHSELISLIVTEKEKIVNEDEKRTMVRNILTRLPNANFKTLELLIKHLSEVAENSNVNLMSVNSLSIVFGPTLMRNEEMMPSMADTNARNAVIAFLIINVQDLFIIE